VRSPPDAERAPTAGGPFTHNTSTPLTKKDHPQDRAIAWIDDEILGVVEILTAARLSAKAGQVPIVQLRRAAVRLVALDAAVADSLDLVDRVRPEAVAHG
jgi:hypothetical protein